MLTESVKEKKTARPPKTSILESVHSKACGCQTTGSRFLESVENFARMQITQNAYDWKIPLRLVQPFHWTCGAQGFQRLMMGGRDGVWNDEISPALSAALMPHTGHQKRSVLPNKTKKSQSGAIDTVIVNGKIFANGHEASWCEALAIGSGVIVSAGSNDAILAMCMPGTQVIDVGGRTVIPGFNDAHMHHTPDPWGIRLPVDPIINPSFDEIRPLIREAVAASDPGTWIYSTMGERLINDLSLNRVTLDELAPDHPVMLLGMTNHTNVVNTAAMHLLGINEEEPDPIGGYFERLPKSRRVSGRINEYAQWSPQRCFASMATIEEGVASLQALSDECIRWGVTTLQNMSWTPVERYVQMAVAADLPIKIRVIRFPPSGTEGRMLSEGRGLKRFINDRIEVHGTKWILDGTPIEGAAAIGRPYNQNTSNSGRENFVASDVSEMLLESMRADEPLLLHAVGTIALESILTAVESLTPEGSQWVANNLRVEHGDGLTRSQVERVSKAGVMVVQNPTHFWFYTDEATFGVLGGAFQSLLDRGITLGIGSDGPLNPFLSLMAAVQHPARPHEAISMENAVRAYTHGSAIGEGKGDTKGRLSAGYAADLAVLSQDIFTIDKSLLPVTKSVMTLVDGDIVYRDDCIG